MELNLTSEIRFRCPHCQKLFCTEADVFSDQVKPYFQCSDCQKDFNLSKSIDSASGLYVTEKYKVPAFSQCPKCLKLKPLKENKAVDECPSCGVLESKFQELQQKENPRLHTMTRAWQVVLQDLTLEESHVHFLNLAQQQSALNLAAQKYNELKAILGTDEIVEKYLKQIEVRLQNQIQNRLQSEAQKTQVDRKAYTGSSRIFIFTGILGTILLIYNKINPTFPNLTGLILAITILSIGSWVMVQKSQ